MQITDKTRADAKAFLGEKAADHDDVELFSSLLMFSREAEQVATELSAANEALNGQVTELSAAVPEPVIELSAGTRKLVSENVALKIDAIAKDRQWNSAYTAKVREAFASDDVIALSAAEGASPTLPVKFLDLLKEQPVKGLDASGKEQTGPQTNAATITLSRNADDGDGEAAKPKVDPYAATIAKLTA